MQTATASGAGPNILNSHSHLLMTETLLFFFFLNKNSNNNKTHYDHNKKTDLLPETAAWSNGCAGGPVSGGEGDFTPAASSCCSASSWSCRVPQKRG